MASVQFTSLKETCRTCHHGQDEYIQGALFEVSQELVAIMDVCRFARTLASTRAAMHRRPCLRRKMPSLCFKMNIPGSQRPKSEDPSRLEHLEVYSPRRQDMLAWDEPFHKPVAVFLVPPSHLIQGHVERGRPYHADPLLVRGGHD